MEQEQFLADYKVGDEYRVLSDVTVREQEDLASAVISELPSLSVVKVLEIGVGPTGRRIKVSSETETSEGCLESCEGWVSCATKNGERLVSHYTIGSDSDTKEESWFSAFASSLSPSAASNSPPRSPGNTWISPRSDASPRRLTFQFPTEAVSSLADVVEATAGRLREAKWKLPRWNASLFVDSPVKRNPWETTSANLENPHPRNQEAALYQYVYSLLWNDSKEVGLNCMKCVSNLQKYELDDEPRDLDLHKRAMKELLTSVSSITCAVESEALSEMSPSTDSSALLALIHPLVERCLFARSSGLVWNLYKQRYANDDDVYAKRAADFRSLDPNTVLESLGVREELRWNTASGSHSSRLSSPYDRAVVSLSHLGSMLSLNCHMSPHELLHMLTMAQLEMKTCALDATHGELELVSMDDIMPVFLIVLTRSSLICPVAAAAFLTDAMDKEESMGGAGRTVVLLETAAQYVAFDWPGPDSQSKDM